MHRHPIGIFSGFVAAWIFLTASSVSQERVQSITDVLDRAQLSGSIAYWSPEKCRPEPFRFPTFPTLAPTIYTNSALGTLREMFAHDSKMLVTQEPSGLIRLAENDVPTDMLDVRIHHISFDDQVIGTDLFNGPIMAMRSILLAPEVQAFATEHKIGPIFSRRIPGNIAYGRHARGELNDVSVSQALDYLLRTFPGYWIYGNCTNDAGQREVYFWFIEH